MNRNKRGGSRTEAGVVGGWEGKKQKGKEEERRKTCVIRARTRIRESCVLIGGREEQVCSEVTAILYALSVLDRL